MLFSIDRTGQPLAVLYDYRHPNSPAPFTFTAVSTTRVDRLVRLNSARVDIDRQGDGYVLRASVPLTDLGFKPQGDKWYAGDFGIVYSDRAGRLNGLRMHWANRNTGIVSDDSQEAAIQPGNWGRFRAVRRIDVP